ncbi:hypothetical protein SCLCIDRAFT_589616 [Scleroderma citrinum Foug A]|uniref:Uncharacterized protein n=1 Tax=Scleroderma citrinum Foug A TaxID=1036808 RepID=A0A0C3DVX6_9AGAM|nr:hypothetical protein SCLCIDRAFT_589616 [Scleroderma citrinum Foug A]
MLRPNLRHWIIHMPQFGSHVRLRLRLRPTLNLPNNCLAPTLFVYYNLYKLLSWSLPTRSPEQDPNGVCYAVWCSRSSIPHAPFLPII